MIRVRLHRKVYADVSEIIDYYEALAGPHLANEFYTELLASIKKAADQPERFRFLERDLRRVNLNKFPYHFLFRVTDDSIRVLVVRHHRRHPSFGLERV